MSHHPNPRDPANNLRYTLETMPGQRKYTFTAATRAEILSELYDAFWGSYAHLFLPNSNSSLPMHATLSEVQASFGFCGAGKEGPLTPGRPCSHVLKKGESCFRCKDCALDDSCVICSRCFHATDHEGHNVSFFIAQQPGGCCDCGDSEAWKVHLNCPYHPPAETTEPTSTSTYPSSGPRGNIPAPVKDYPHRVNVPPELRESMNRTIGYALDFVLDTLDFSPDEPSVPSNEADLRLQPSADPMLKDQYCVIIWNDDKHSFDEVIKLICDLTGRARDEAAEMTLRIDENGREIIEMNTDVTRLLEMAQTIAQIDLGVTIRRAYDTFREQVASVIIEWLVDLTQCRLGTDTLILREIIAEEMLSARKRDNATASYNAQALLTIPDVREPTRLDYLFLSHTRLWKKPRLSLKEIYTAILTLGRDHKLAVAGHFAQVYHRVIDAYLLVDREAETSIKYFALQLFTVPSVANYIVRNHKIITRLLAIITAFFTNQIVDKHIAYTPSSTSYQLDVDTFPFKSKRFMPVFSDLRYLCHNEPVQELIAHNPEYIIQFAKTCQLFMCVNPNKRAVTNHVEFETDAWISVFNVTLSLSRVIKVYGSAFGRATTAELVSAISTVMHNILMVCTLNEDRLDRTKFPPIAFHEVTFGDTLYKIVEFDVLEGWVSFHHSLHWLLAELFKHVDLLTEERLREVGMSSIRDVVLRRASEQAVLTVIDFPLRVLAMIAQIRTGLWVRNGFAIRGQLLHYRDFMLRELCYDQDLFMLQVALGILDPNTVIVTILDRFGLSAYFSGAFLHSTYDPTQLSGMVEEVLYVFITILSESASISKLPIEKQIRRELVHALAIGPCTYTDLIKRVSERLVEDAWFERVLKDVATFRPPESTSDTGSYELKDEVYDEVNPFFYHYTRNKREEVEVILRNRLKKKNPDQPDPVWVPKPMEISVGPYSIITSTFESEALLQVMFYSIYNVLVVTAVSSTAPPSSEAILDQVLHLIMLAIVERAVIFCRLSAVKAFEEEKTLIDVLCALEHNDNFKPYKGRVGWILDNIEKHAQLEVQSRRFVPSVLEGTPDPEEMKKKAAKARQEAIIKQMKQQQASFAINFDDIDDEEDEDMLDAEQQEVSYGTCIVCQEDLNSSKSFGSLGMVQPSRFIRRQPDGHTSFLNSVLQSPSSMDRPLSSGPSTFPPRDADALDEKAGTSPNYEGFPNQYTRFGLHASVCSHMMHLECFQVYSVSIRQRHRAQSTRNHPETIPRKEYICPLCKSLGNVIIPVTNPPNTSLNTVPFADWIRSAGISILKSKPDPQLESLQFRNGTGEFVFWSAQDSAYSALVRSQERIEGGDPMKMVDTVMAVSKSLSQQTRHLRERHEPELGERGAGIYLPEELVGYSVGCIEIALRGVDSRGGLVLENLSDAQMKMIRGLLTILVKLAGLHFKNRPDEGRDAMRQAIIKRLLPEWSRSSLTSFSFPLLLRDPFTVLVETAAVAPEILPHVLVLTYYACLARTVIGLVFVLNKSRGIHTAHISRRTHEDVFGDVRMFFMSVVRHSPIFEHTATLAFETFGEARIEKFLHAFTLPFLRKAAILCRSVLPSAFPLQIYNDSQQCEYRRLFTFLGIPPLADLPNQDTLQNALSGWCAHYGHSHAVSPLNFGVTLDMPGIYRFARMPMVLDNLFVDQDKAVVCQRCNTIPPDPAVCLLCGTTVCFQSTCCMDLDERRGECNMHTRECGGAMGIYFLIKRCVVLYLYGNSGSFTQSPYLDVHGEVDVSMRRGRRQYLHHARWEDVRKTWLNHNIPTVIARKLESSLDSGGWETL
ncbi:E3 ubiquitin-protein ligase ubr1 [Marasmius tenuissimus]|uniref:E3 ubiquitin-protein ligase n=1 Tax=Marasmius tenuissimus TaxID=585030 RepID=A0ABR2ZR06_9AGAR